MDLIRAVAAKVSVETASYDNPWFGRIEEIFPGWIVVFESSLVDQRTRHVRVGSADWSARRQQGVQILDVRVVDSDRHEQLNVLVG
jgi:hypothetical protein